MNMFIDRNCLDPFCPCQDGDSCHYETTEESEAWTIPAEYAIVGRTYERILDEDRLEEL